MKETILQFGEGNFLRAFVEDFIDKMNKDGLYGGRVVIVKPRPGSLEKFDAQGCRYHLLLRGIEDGRRVSRLREIDSVSRVLDPYTDFDAFLALAENPDLRFIVSNTTEAGIAFDPACRFEDRPALSFPGKLTQLLFARLRAGLRGFVLLPCELIDDNGDRLKDCVLRYAALWGLGEDFVRWVEEENVFASTLVDRIVTGFPADAEEVCPGDRLLDAAEPYHLWAIGGDFEHELPLQKAGVNVVWTDDIRPIKKRKVRLLNGAHTAMVFPALLAGAETVGEALADPDVGTFLRRYLWELALPVLGDTPENRAFASAVLERFANPFIRHQLRSIALNSVSKFAVRVLPTALDAQAATGTFPRAAAVSLAALIYYYKTREAQDEEKAVAFLRANDPETVLGSGLFGTPLPGAKAQTGEAYRMIEAGKIREAMRWAFS